MGHSCASSKCHVSSLQNERFVRDFLQNSLNSNFQNERFIRDFFQNSQLSSSLQNEHETSSKSHNSSLQNERFARDPLQKSHVKSPKRVLRISLPGPSSSLVSHETSPKTRQVCKASASHETSSKSHASKSPIRAFRARPPPKVKREDPSELTH